MTFRDYIPLLEAFALVALVLLAASLLVWYLERRKRHRQARPRQGNTADIAKRLSQLESPKERVPHQPALTRHRPALQPLLSRVRGRREPANMPPVISLPHGFDPQTLRWPPKCVYCGEPSQAEATTTIGTSNTEEATIRIPYCTPHSQEAARNRTIIKAAQLAGPVVGVLLGVCTLAALALLWRGRILTDCAEAPKDCANALLDFVFGGLALLALAALAAAEGPDVALGALSRIMPSLKHSHNPYTLLGLEVSDTTIAFLNEQIAAEFKRLNPSIP